MIRIATVFSGIGAAEQALKQIGIEHEIVFACDNGERYLKQSAEEIGSILDNFSKETREAALRLLYESTGKPNNVKKSYFANYEIDEERWFEDIRFVDGKPFKGTVDLFVGGSPCQSFSTYGKRKGLEDTRGTLFYDYARLIKEICPKVFVFENVTGLLNHDKGKTWETIREVFESLNYKITFDVLDAQYYNLPQMRKRLFVVGVRNDIKKKFKFPDRVQLEHTAEFYLDEDVDNIYYLGPKGFDYVTDGDRNEGRARVNREVIGCQTANQQFNWTGDFRVEIPKQCHLDDERIYKGMYNGELSVARKLTPEECLKLMGFEDFEIVVPDQVMYRQAGNSIAVPVLKAIFEKIFEVI